MIACASSRPAKTYSARIRQEGEQTGMQIGEANILMFLLEQKLGSVPDGLRQRIQQADPDILLRWSARVLTEDSIDAVLR